MTIQIGKPNYNSSGENSKERATYHRLTSKDKDGHSDPGRTLVVRIAPPIGDCAERGIWRRYIKQHFGYGVPYTYQGNTKFSHKVFLCPENKDRDGNITNRCPECSERQTQEEKLKEKMEALKKAGKTKEDIQVAVRPIASWLKAHNQDRKWHMVAKNLEGTWGFLTISHKCMKLLLEEIRKLVDRGVDPLGVEKGVWFRFTRNGKDWNEINDIPKVEMIEGDDGTYRVKYDTLTQADFDAMGKLDSLMSLGHPLTVEQIQMLVESGGEEETVRAVFGMPSSTQKSLPDEDPTPDELADPGPRPGSLPVPDRGVETKVETEVKTATDTDEVAKLKALLAAAMANSKPATDAKPAPKPPPANSGQLKKDLEMPMDEFLAQFENK